MKLATSLVLDFFAGLEFTGGGLAHFQIHVVVLLDHLQAITALAARSPSLREEAQQIISTIRRQHNDLLMSAKGQIDFGAALA